MNRTQAKHVFNVAVALRESRKPEDFTMAAYYNDRGTPACALGHYAERRDLQKLFQYKFGGITLTKGRDNFNFIINPFVLRHFGINEDEAQKLFSDSGCGYSTTALEAARYIEHFLVEKGFRLKDLRGTSK